LIKNEGMMGLYHPKIVGGLRTFYPQGQLVGKKMNQVTRNNQGVLSGGRDDDVFKHVDQALSSAFAIIQWAAQGRHANIYHAIVPMLVIPDDRLWCVDYTETGDGQSPDKYVRSRILSDSRWR